MTTQAFDDLEVINNTAPVQDNTQPGEAVITPAGFSEAMSNIPQANPNAPTGPGFTGSQDGGALGDLTRPRRRVIGNAAAATLGGNVNRNYQVSNTVQFTNFVELKNDMISPEYCQELIEEIMGIAGIDMANANATRMTEDVIFTFYVENAASQKTGHEKVVDIYGKEFDMMLVLNVLVSHGVTPRRFTRGLAKRIHAFIRMPENSQLRADLVRRYSLTDPDHAAIAFDGSTHVPNLPNDQKQVADMLASRGIFETVASAKNATDRTTYDGVLTQNTMKSGALHLN